MAPDTDEVITNFLQAGILHDSLVDIHIRLQEERRASLTLKLEEYRVRLQGIVEQGDVTVHTERLHDTTAKRHILELLLRPEGFVGLSESRGGLPHLPRKAVDDAFLVVAAYNAGVGGVCVGGGTGITEAPQ